MTDATIHPLSDEGPVGESELRFGVAGRATTFSARIVARVRDALFEKRLKPGDFLGTEKDLAARFGVSRIVARDALRTLEACGVVEIRVGAGGGARIARGRPELFADALAIQLNLTGVSVAEIMDAQRAIETTAVELAATRADDAQLARLAGLLDEAEALLDDVDRFTRTSWRFHLAIAEASHNRVLAIQLISLQYVAWPSRNRTLTRAVARRVLADHRRIHDRIAARDAGGARAVMADHLGLIRARRVRENGEDAPCC